MRVLFFFLLLLFTQQLLADSNITEQVKNSIMELISSDDVNTSKDNNLSKVQKEELVLKEEKEKKHNAEIKALFTRINLLKKEKQEIDDELIKNNLWASVYFNHETYQHLDIKLQALNDELKLYKSKSVLTSEEQLEFDKKTKKYKVIEGKIKQLKDYKEDPFVELYTAPEITKEPAVTNPLDIITVMSYKKQLETLQDEYLSQYQVLEDAIYKLHKKSKILQELVVKTRGKAYTKYVDELRATQNKIADFEETLEIFKTASNAFNQEVSQVNTTIDDTIDAEVEKSIVAGAKILFLLLFFFFIKYLVKKYMSDNELFYGTNKVINFLFIILVFTILLFTY